MSLFNVTVTLVEDILGTLPGDQEIYKTYIASKAPDASTITEEIEAVGKEEIYNKNMTVFARDENGDPFIYNYLVKGFFKNACAAMREVHGSKSSKLTSYKKRIDNLVFVWPRKIPMILENGERASNENIIVCERPLRAQTPQGERVAISVSEQLPAGMTLTFQVETLGYAMDKLVIEWLDYGKYNGLGQWHNSGKGSFTYTYEMVRDDSPKGVDAEDDEEAPAPKKRGRKKKEVEATEEENK